MPQQQPVRRARLAWALLGLTVVLLVLSLVIAVTGGETFDTKFATIPVELAFAVVGALVAARTGNRIGWLFLGAGLAAAASLATQAYAARPATAELPGAAWAGWIFPLVLGILAPLFFLTPLLFPDGGRPRGGGGRSSGWRSSAGLVRSCARRCPTSTSPRISPRCGTR